MGKWSEVEIDLLSLDPPIIVECTSFIDKDEFGKATKLVYIRNVLNKRYEKNFDIYLTALAIHGRIKEKLTAYCRKNNINLITQFTDYTK